MERELVLGWDEQYGKTAIDIINHASILTAEELNVISELKDELVDNFLYAQVFRTRTEMEVSVLNDLKFPTPDSKYWQAQREQGLHFHELVMLSYEYRKNLVEIKKLERKISRIKLDKLDENDNDLEKELLQIELEKLKFMARNHERVAKDRIREIWNWHEIKDRLLPSMEFSITDVDEHQLVAYTRRWIKQTIVAGNSGSPSERQNLQGQLDAGIKACIAKKCLHKVLNEFEPKVRKEISNHYGLELSLTGKLTEGQ